MEGRIHNARARAEEAFAKADAATYLLLLTLSVLKEEGTLKPEIVEKIFTEASKHARGLQLNADTVEEVHGRRLQEAFSTFQSFVENWRS